MAGTLTVQNLQGPTSGANANKIIVPSGQTFEVPSGAVLDASGGTLVPSAGQVVQTVNVVYNTQWAFTNLTYTDTTGFTASITPTSSSNKILILFSIFLGMSGPNTTLIRLNRNGSPIGENPNLSTGTSFVDMFRNGPSTGLEARQFLDNPATTSTVVYQVQHKVDAAVTGYINRHLSGTAYGGQSNLTLMEIAQ